MTRRWWCSTPVGEAMWVVSHQVAATETEARSQHWARYRARFAEMEPHTVIREVAGVSDEGLPFGLAEADAVDVDGVPA